MEKKIITISREFGSGGRSIGRMVAEKLGIPTLLLIVSLVPLICAFYVKNLKINQSHPPYCTFRHLVQLKT